jgi:hypothetical protein
MKRKKACGAIRVMALKDVCRRQARPAISDSIGQVQTIMLGDASGQQHGQRHEPQPEIRDSLCKTIWSSQKFLKPDKDHKRSHCCGGSFVWSEW